MNKQERAYQIIGERILNGTYGPGYRLVIDALAEELGVSPLPVREAIRRLEAEGLVIYQPNAGARVAPADPDQYENALTVLAVLEGYATALAAPHIRPADLKRLGEIDDRMVACMDTLDSLNFGRLNHEFHQVIYNRCPNAALVEALRDTTRKLDVIRRTVFTQIPYRGWKSIEEHRALVRLIESGAPAAEIEAAARQHKLKTVEAFRAWSNDSGSGASAGASGETPAEH
ncbi:GntR family transcriptional regulator [Actinoallomurus liliacearum]|uniref:GntR family transcriptional regulator n=1 Tax=Actinoallomurus liliacearum TaxID=1080073 RepID=A0ABP8T9T8_9ACTN